MSFVEITVYSTIVGIALLFVYAVPQFELSKSVIRFTLSREARTHQKVTSDATAIRASGGEVTVHKGTSSTIYGGTWWTEDSLFQLERRAIFSKVSSLYHFMHLLIMN